MTYKIAFPDFDRGAIIDQLVEAGWTDESWANDGCPRVHCGDACIWLDYADPALKVCADGKPFAVEFLEDGQFMGDGSALDLPTLKAALNAIHARWFDRLFGVKPLPDDDVDSLAKYLAEYAAESDLS